MPDDRDHRPVYRPDSHEEAVLAVRGGWDYSDIPKNVVLGEGVFIETPGVFRPYLSTRHPGMIIGDRVRIYLAGWGSSFTVEPHGLVEIGDDSVLVGAQIMCSDHVKIGRGCVISYNAVIADSDFHPTDYELRRKDAISGSVYGEWFGFSERRIAPVVIGDGVKIGINAIVLKGVTIGDGAEIGPGTVVSSDVPAGAIVVGNPFEIVGKRTSK